MVGIRSDIADLQSQGRSKFSLHVQCELLGNSGTDVLLGRYGTEVAVRRVGLEEWKRAERGNWFLEGLRERGGAVQGRHKYTDVGPRQSWNGLELAVAGYGGVIDSVSAAQHYAVTVRQHAVGEAQSRAPGIVSAPGYESVYV